MLERPLALALSAGAAQGAVQVGMIRALEERSIIPDIVVGTSVGAINGAFVAASPGSSSAVLEQVWGRVSRAHLFVDPWPLRLRNIIAQRHLFSSNGLRKMFEMNFDVDQSIDDLAITYASVTTDLAAGLPHTIQTGDLLTALLATCAIPGYLQAVQLSDRLLVDGYLAARLPVIQATELGAKTIIALDSAGPVRAPRSSHVARILKASFDATMFTQSRLSIEVAATRARVVHLKPQAELGGHGLGFERTSKLIEHGYVSVQTELDDLDRSPTTGGR